MLDKVWMTFGHMLDKVWMTFGHVLDKVWMTFGRSFSICWPYIGIIFAYICIYWHIFAYIAHIWSIYIYIYIEICLFANIFQLCGPCDRLLPQRADCGSTGDAWMVQIIDFSKYLIGQADIGQPLELFV